MSNELSKVISVFTAHLDETKKDKEQLDALGVVLRQLLNMLKDRQSMESVYGYLDKTHDTESTELNTALKTILSEPLREITTEALSDPVIDMTGIDLSLESLTKQDIPEIKNVIKRCYTGTRDIDKRLGIEDFNYDWEYKKQRFWEDNGFTFYTDARYNQYIKMMKPHDEVYNSCRYRFALLDDSMNNVSFRFFGLAGLDFYDGAMPNWRVTDCYFAHALIYDSTMAHSRFSILEWTTVTFVMQFSIEAFLHIVASRSVRSQTVTLQA